MKISNYLLLRFYPAIFLIVAKFNAYLQVILFIRYAWDCEFHSH